MENVDDDFFLGVPREVPRHMSHSGVGGSYPIPSLLSFCPGGIRYHHHASSQQQQRMNHYCMFDIPGPAASRSIPLIECQRADHRLYQYCQLLVGSTTTTTTPIFLPSLSVLAESVFGRLTGCKPDDTKAWADAMVLAYFQQENRPVVQNEQDIWSDCDDEQRKPAAATDTAATTTTETVASILKQIHQRQQQEQSNNHAKRMLHRPCGYVFKRGDIAWNCRTCQADPTCVICDDCYQNSNHEGHEVYFHRTSPGGCCDCGDVEAWKIAGCCDAHRPPVDDHSSAHNNNNNNNNATTPTSSSSTAAVGILSLDPMEAVRTAEVAHAAAIETLQNPHTKLPDLLQAALGIVIGAAVQAILEAVDGSGVGADAVQWTRRWADEAARIANGTPHNEDYYYQQQQHGSGSGNIQWATPDTFNRRKKTLPDHYKLLLRLHNDDVHTFDEVIDALHEPRSVRRNHDEELTSLVPLRDHATDMTHRVDSDGQVTVKTYNNIPAAMRGFRRLKSRGLHCAVVSTAQMEAEQRARALTAWLNEVASAHPVAQAILVHALVQINDAAENKMDDSLAGVYTWHPARMIPPWVAVAQDVVGSSQPSLQEEMAACRVRFTAFPPHLASSYLTREECELLHGMALTLSTTTSPDTEQKRNFVDFTRTVPDFYALVPYRLPSWRYHKSPHSLWGTLPAQYSDPLTSSAKHPLLEWLATGNFNPERKNTLTESIYVVDTDLRKQQEGEGITSNVFPHKLPGLHMISGIGTIRMQELTSHRPPLPSPMDWRHLLATSSFRSPLSPALLLLLLDPYPPKQLRGILHVLFLSLLTNPRFKSRFAGAMAVAYRPLSTLFCAGIGTEADTPLHFTVQIFTTGSLIRALSYGPSVEKLLVSDQCGSVSEVDTSNASPSIGVFLPPLAHIIVRCIHTNLLGATKEVNMILKNTESGNDDNSHDESPNNSALLPALTYVAGEHPLMTVLPAAPDDGFLESRSTRHKRLPHLLRDLDYVIETPGAALRLLLPAKYPVYQGPSLSFRGEDVLTFPIIFARMLRLAQGMDPQKRKISGGHVEYEQNRWLEAFGLSLNFGGTRDALAESPCNPVAGIDDGAYLLLVSEAIGNIIAALLREIKLWLYREGMLETGLPVPSGASQMPIDLAQLEALQRSTLHVTSSQLSNDEIQHSSSPENSVALSCATGIKMTEAQLTLIENALKIEAAQRLEEQPFILGGSPAKSQSSTGPLIEDWLRVPHAPFAGDSLSFHLPLHRAVAKFVRSFCSVVIPESYIATNPGSWWKIPVLDMNLPLEISSGLYHPLVPLIRTTLRSSNCRVVWSAGPDCTSQEAQRRRARSRTVSANIAVAKVVHSLADHPIRCLAAAQQIERHLWARNGTSVAGMAMNYSSAPLCRSFRDLDLLLVQLSASGMSCGLGARRIFSLLVSRFSLDGYLCDPERKIQSSSSAFASSIWVNPPRLQDPDHAVILMESFFSTLCVLVTELPPPPPSSSTDDAALRRSIRRELLHALAAEPRSHSEAMAAASCGISRREESEGASCGGGLFRVAFASVLREIGKQKSQGSSRASSSPPAYELKADCCDEYDPSFFHLRRQEHQHAMDVIARLRKQKWGDRREALETHCFPLVCAPPEAHPRFLPCRLLLHLEMMDASLRRALLFALTNGCWLPPPEPEQNEVQSKESGIMAGDSASIVGVSTTLASLPGSEAIPMTTFTRRMYQAQSSFPKRSSPSDNAPFSEEVVAASSVSFLEVLQLLTLQVHTLVECASLHRTLPDLDGESRSLSASLSINSYLGRLIRVPDSLVDVWALKPYPRGPLKSKGSGERRGSLLGLLIALYEHRSDHASIMSTEGKDYSQNDDGHGGARALASSGLKWLLRFVDALVAGAPSVGSAVKCATTGTPMKTFLSSTSSVINDSGSGQWTIDEDVRTTIIGMLENLPDLWPKPQEESKSPGKSGAKAKEAGKAAQLRALELMKRKQAQFAATMANSNTQSDQNGSEQEADLCIICRCDDTDGENNGPLGYLGHVQRSRMLQMLSIQQQAGHNRSESALVDTFRVVGHMGCQLRETEAMDSKPLVCLPKGSLVTVLRSRVSNELGVLSRRVLVRHVKKDSQTNKEQITEGWASVQSSQGYIILSPLISLCYSSSRWGGTRPIIKQCGHAAHMKCVEAHTLSLHQRAAGDQPYDGRFAANISDGEFLCPLCKQLSNILIPRDGSCCHPSESRAMEIDESSTTKQQKRSIRTLLSGTRSSAFAESTMGRKALEDFGSHLHAAMNVPWDRTSGSRRKRQEKWHPSIQKWDYEEDDSDNDEDSEPTSVKIGSVMRLLRQQLIAWATVGHSAAALEVGSRALEEVLPFGTVASTSDPWPAFTKESRDRHSMLFELKRTLAAASGLLEVLHIEMARQLARREMKSNEMSVIGSCLSDILTGQCWIFQNKDAGGYQISDVSLLSELTALISAMPCHVAKDGTISHSSEARASAAAMWVVKGLPYDGSEYTEPPAPLAIRQLFTSDDYNHPPIPENWGTMLPFVEKSPSEKFPPPFRPGVASGFLYTPMLAWDFYILSGAVLSYLLLNEDSDLPTDDELLNVAHTLLIGRIVQVLICPKEKDLSGSMDLDDEECWNDEESKTEGAALAMLFAHCRNMIETKTINFSVGLTGNPSGLPGSELLADVGRSILPFARALILMLRACTAVIRERQQRLKSFDPKASELESLLYRKDLMTVEDGFSIVKAMCCATPVKLIDEKEEFLCLINRWLISATVFEMHHGSVGRSILRTVAPPTGSISPAHERVSRSNSGNISNDDVQMDLGDLDRPSVDRIVSLRREANNFALDGGMEDSDEELADSIEEAEEIFDQIVESADVGNGDPGESSDVSSSDSDDGGSFANVSRSAILPYQPSILGLEGIGASRQGSKFDFSIANCIMSDLSYFGIGHVKNVPVFTLIRLPKSFVELYNIVNKVKGRDDSTAMDDSDDGSSTETAICLLTGTVMRSGSPRRLFGRSPRLPGACTLHARKTASGIGIFFLVQKCTVLLMHNSKSAYSPSLYVDEHGEEDPQLRRGRPLFLNEARYRALELLWRQQGIPREVAQIRSTSDRVIRDNWY